MLQINNVKNDCEECENTEYVFRLELHCSKGPFKSSLTIHYTKY